jgi:predicted metalloendopeptidase
MPFATTSIFPWTRRLCKTIVSVLIAGAAVSAQSQSGFSVRFLDRTADACTDFYQFACGNWMAAHPVPADRPRFGRMAELAERNEAIVRDILERAAVAAPARTPNEQRIGDYYASCTDEKAVEQKGAMPIAPLLREVESVNDRAALVRLAGRFTHDGLPTFLQFGPAPNSRDSSMFIATLGQGALGLPDRDLYLRDDERSKMLRTAYLAHVQKMFELLGQPAQTAAATARAVMDAETAVARASYDRVTLRDVRKRDNPMTTAELTQLAPHIDFATFFKEAGAPGFTRLNAINPQYLKDMSAAVDTMPLAAWKAYMSWRALSTLAPYLSSPFQIERFNFAGRILSGQQQMQPRWKRCVAAVAGSPGNDQLGEIVGGIFIREHFGAQAQARMNELIAALEHSLERNIGELDWMGPETRRRALEKLKAINHKIGAPSKWRDFSAVKITRDDFLANAVAVSIDDTQRQMRWIGTPVDKDLWLMTPQTVNAYYAPPLNEIAFPAGILQPPFFDPAADDAVNFGGIGSVIGHELSHGFDDQGRRYDAKGNLTDWWTPDDDKAFRDRAACVATQYSGYTAIGETKVNGALTLGENVADNAGVRIAYYALMEVLAKKGPQPPIDGFTPEQRFFVAWAQAWCENATEQDARRRAQEDNHSPGRWRAMGVLQNSEEFRKAFGCAVGTPMAPANVCRVW